MNSNQTDAHRRLAAQLAIQLPSDAEEARRVLALTREFLDDFLIEGQGDARRRARLLGWRLDLATIDQVVPAAWRRLGWSTLWALSSLFVSMPVALLMVEEFGLGAGMASAFFIMVVALVTGTVPALTLAVVTSVLHNLLIVPPALEFSAPTAGEIVAAVCYVMIAIAAPWISARRRRIRAVIPRLVVAEPDMAAGLRLVDSA